MKKLITLALAAALMLSLTACGDPAAYDLYLKMNDKQKNIKSLEMQTDAIVNVEVMGQSVEMNMSGVTKQIIRSETDIDMEMSMTTSVMGMDIPTITYFKDGYLYQDVMGEKIKIAVDLEEAMQMANFAQFSFGKDAIKSSSVTKVDGGSLLFFELEPEFLRDTLSSMTDSIAQALGSGEDMAMTFTQMNYETLIDDDYMMQNAVMEFTVEMDLYGEAATMHYVVSMDVTGYNHIDKIDFPDDLDTYVEM